MAITMPDIKPFRTGVGTEDFNVLQRINWKYFLQRIPMLLFAMVSSYGVGHLLNLSGLPFPIDYLGAVSFDIGFLGVIALSDQQLTKSLQNKIAYYLLNFTMSGLAALFNVLAHANGKYTNITPEDITVGVPFAVVGLFFALFYESIMSAQMKKQDDDEEKNKNDLQLTAFKCKYCGTGFQKQPAVYGHYRSCTMKTTHDRNSASGTCKCLLCKV